MTARSRYDRWPALLRKCARALGEDAALRLADVLGGQKISVPLTRSPSLEAKAGEAIAAFLIEEHGGEAVHIPSFTQRMLAEERRLHVLQNPRRSANALAGELRISSRRVEQIRHEALDDPRQPSLFD